MRPLLDRMEERTAFEPNTGCWLYLGERNRAGYGRIGVGHKSKKFLVHRVSFERSQGPIPDGLELDHKCRMRACWNPHHLEAVTHQTNIRRGEVANRTHCPRGHEYNFENTLIKVRRDGGGTMRQCRACMPRWYRSNRGDAR